MVNPISLISPISNLSIQDPISDKIKTFLSTEKDQDKETALKGLEAAFIDLKEVDSNSRLHNFLLITIIGRYGNRLYPNFETSLPYLLTSLSLQLQKLKLIPEKNLTSFDNLKEIENLKHFEEVTHYLTTTNPQSNLQNLEKLTLEEKLHFADTLNRAGDVFCNLHKFNINQPKPEAQPFLDQKKNLYACLKELLESMKNDSVSVEEKLGELQYNIYPGLFLAECEVTGNTATKDQMLESFVILDKSTTYNPSDAMKARIANLKACWIFDYDLEAAKNFEEKSIDLWKNVLTDPTLSSAKKEQYQNLYGNANSTYISILIKLKEKGDLKADEVNKHVIPVEVAYMKAKESHPYSMILGYNLARVAFSISGDSQKALNYLTEVKEISRHYQEWPQTKKVIENASQLMEKIQASNAPL